ncbi:MAG: DUF1553 domain-containing protein [Gemmataceae bacterium]
MSVRRPLRWAVVAAAVLVVGPAAAGEKLQYNRDVRPILAENCFACHGADSAARKAKLRLDDREAAIEKGSITPGKPDDSELIARIVLAEDDEQLMPPKASHKKLTAAQKATLKRWVAEGAEYQPHWSFIPPTRPAVPAVKDKAWVRTPVDAFILAELEKRGLKPAPEADKRTLARRLALDLTGLPPNPADVEAFVKDASPGAYERYVDALLASPHWGEHRGRYWLDAARYADTHGIHFDNYREVWSYRDWVINAFNQNKPFDRFTTEQLAGDLLPNPTLDQKIATGFNRCNITTNEGGAIDEEYLVLYARDRTETMAQVWLGLTAGCAVCHDHKYDPLSMKDFYSLTAFFNNTTQRAMDGNVKDTPPIIPVPRAEDRPRWAAVQKELAAGQAKLEARKAAAKVGFAEWLKTATPAAVLNTRPADKLGFYAWLDEGAGTTAHATLGGRPQVLQLPAGTTWEAGPVSAKAVTVKQNSPLVVPEVGDFERDKPFSYGAWVRVPNRGQYGGILARMDEQAGYRGWDLWLDNDKFAVHLVNTWPTNALKVATKSVFNPNNWYHVFVTSDGTGKASGVRIYVNGESQPLDVAEDRLTATIRVPVPVKVGQRHHGQKLRQVGVQDLRLYDRALTAQEVQSLAQAPKAAEAVAKPADKRSGPEADAAFDWYLASQDAPYREVVAGLAALRREEVDIRARGTVAHVSAEKPTPAEAYVLYRGEYDKRRDKVGAITPKALPAFPADLPRNRLGLAKWLLRDDHPLTARVTVNRFWQEVFGRGLVRTAGDFGVSGELPTHPELLDWLAKEFQTDWDVKRFFKLLVTSSVYRQSAAATAEKLEKDPQNVWLGRGPRFRMDAEMVRDYALAAGGSLVPKIGGPSVRPYQPPGVWEAVAMPESNTRLYRQDAGESLYRRSVYTFWKRAAPPASMEIFNAPNRETCAVLRERTNTPLQALVTLNDVQMVEAARRLAQVCLGEGTDDAGRLDAMARRVLARPLTADEAKVVTAVLDRLRAHYADKPADAAKLITYGESKPDPKVKPAELAAWTMVANQLLNLDEALCK